MVEVSYLSIIKDFLCGGYESSTPGRDTSGTFDGSGTASSFFNGVDDEIAPVKNKIFPAKRRAQVLYTAVALVLRYFLAVITPINTNLSFFSVLWGSGSSEFWKAFRVDCS